MRSSPAHTPGSCVLLDHQTRILFTGDAAHPNLLASALPLATTLRSLLKIKSLQSEYNRIYNGHTAYAGTMDAFQQDPRVLEDLIANCRGILRGEIKGKSVPNFLFPGRNDSSQLAGRRRSTSIPANCGFRASRTGCLEQDPILAGDYLPVSCCTVASAFLT